MSLFYSGLIIGLFAGVLAGIFYMSLLIAASDANKKHQGISRPGGELWLVPPRKSRRTMG